MSDCPQCSHPTTPDNHFPVSDGSAYHVLCYQDATIAAGLPDPFPICDGCAGMIWEFDDAGDLALVVRGSVCYTDPATAEHAWRAARWHLQCAPSDANDAVELDQRDDVAQLASDALDDLAELPDGALNADAPAQPTGPPGDPTIVVLPTQDFAEGGKPICPRCAKPVLRTPTAWGLGSLHYHKSCAAKEKAAVTPRVRLGGNPKCKVCARSITPAQVRTERVIDCAEEGAPKPDYYHRVCYRKACIEAGMDDPFPPTDPKATKARLDAGKVRAARARKEATVNCGICSMDILRAEFVNHVVPCAEAARTAAIHEELNEDADEEDADAPKPE